MKIALLGKGKTGGRVLELLVQNHIPHTIFDSKNHPTLENLKGHDVVISFLSGGSVAPIYTRAHMYLICTFCFYIIKLSILAVDNPQGFSLTLAYPRAGKALQGKYEGFKPIP